MRESIRLKKPASFLLGILLLGIPLLAAAREETYPKEYWEVIVVSGIKVGYTYERTERIVEDGKEVFKTVSEQKLNLKRLGTGMEILTKSVFFEDSQGHPFKMEREMNMGGSQISYEGEVREGKFYWKKAVLGAPGEFTSEWDPEILGPVGLDRFRKEILSEYGKKFTVKGFDFDMGGIMVVHMEVVSKGTVDVRGKEMDLVETRSFIEMMPNLVSKEWFDEAGEKWMSETDLVGQKFLTYKSTKEEALQEKPEGKTAEEEVPDFLLKSSVPSNVYFPHPYRLNSALYRLTFKDKGLHQRVRLEDAHQKIEESGDDFLHLRVKGQWPSKPAIILPCRDSGLSEYLKANQHIQSDDEDLVRTAKQVIHEERDAWKAAKMLEKFAFEYIKDKNLTVGFASAKEVLENPAGDCSEHGVFLAALCRCVGIPSRVAVGLLYFNGVFGGHMWTEVYVGEWLALDATLANPYVDAARIRFDSNSLNGMGVGEFFLNFTQCLGRFDLEVKEFTQGGKTVQVTGQFKEYTVEGDLYRNTLWGFEIVKPSEWKFEDLDRGFFDPKLLEIEGEESGKIEVIGHAITYSTNMETLLSEIAKKESATLTGESKIGGYRACHFQKKVGENQEKEIIFVLVKDVLYIIRIKHPKGVKPETIEKMLKSIKFLES